MALYNREIDVTIGTPGLGGLKISDLRISFDIHKDDSNDINEASVNIYNLSVSSRGRIDELDELLFLSAGYTDGDGKEDLFIGNISNVTHSIQPPDVITSITVTDGSKDIIDKKTKISFESGSSATTILKRVLSSFSLANNFNSISFTDKKYVNGFSFSGASTTALDKVTKFLGLDWSIQNNEIKLVEFDGDDGSEIISLSPSTGLIGSPEKFQYSVRVAKGKAKLRKPGWKIRSLIQPKVIPGGRVIVSSKEIPEDSIFSVMNITHVGDTHQNDWASLMEVKE